MEEVEFNGEKTPDENAIPYVPYTPPLVKMITQGSAKPPLCNIGDGMGQPAVYTVGTMRFYANLKLTEEFEEWDIETPLAMCRYVKPEGDMLFNIQACEDATRENARRRLHNKFVVDLFREFMPRYDCGASANKMTEPQPPPDFVQDRMDKIKELKKDKVGTVQKAIEYLALFEVYCGRDYKFEEAFEKASDRCFEETVKAKQQKGRVRVRIEGRRPCWWDGVSKTDGSGCRVKFAKGDGHTFLTPDVRVVKDETVTDIVAIGGDEIETEANTEEENPFESLCASSVKEQRPLFAPLESIVIESAEDDAPNESEPATTTVVIEVADE